MKRTLAIAMAVCMMGTTVYAAEQKEQVKAIPVSQEVSLDGHTEKMQGYNIDGYTYFRLRDMAEQITEHCVDFSSHFYVSYDAKTKKINLLRAMDYESSKVGEPYIIGSEIKTAVPSKSEFAINGADLGKYGPKGYVIDGYTYYKMRDFSLMIGLDIEWCEGDRVIEITSVQEPILDEDGNPMYAARKPVIYLYPEETTDISVSLDYDGELTFTYPAYNNGWTVTAQPDGTLTNHADGREYSYLFWEGEGYGEMDFSEGFMVKGEDTVSFLQEKLAAMGMTPKEYNEFIVYWLPYMQDNAYNLISFQWENYDKSAKLNITPEPDNMLRVFMAFKALDEAVEIPEQNLPVLNREGFTVVEWGGTEVY